jgi:HAMP domain-containing protein
MRRQEKNYLLLAAGAIHPSPVQYDQGFYASLERFKNQIPTDRNLSQLTDVYVDKFTWIVRNKKVDRQIVEEMRITAQALEKYILGNIEQCRKMEIYSLRVTMIHIGWMLAAVVLLALAFGLVTVRRLVVRLRNLTRVCQDISGGDFRNIPVAHGNDEIAGLTNAIGRMAQIIEFSSEEKDRWIQTLEQTVSERTTRLQEALGTLRDRYGELEKFSKLSVGRELRMVELKQKIAGLEKKLKELEDKN